ncbi:MAG: hypothetical protein WCI39_04190 [Gallionellaceae bacterium]
MKIFQNSTAGVIAGLMLAMALTRFNHFGSSIALPDASLAVFFLGGLYLARFSGALAIFVALLAEAALVDYYAITVQGTSDWCVTPAYGFLAVAYAVMWFAGRGLASRHSLNRQGLLRVFATVGVASTVAFAISNISFLLFSGRYAAMSAVEYAASVVQYWGSYVVVAMLYVGCVVFAQMVFLFLNGKAHRDSHVA